MSGDYIEKMDSRFLNWRLDIFYLFINEFGEKYLTEEAKTVFNQLKAERAARIDSEIKPIILLYWYPTLLPSVRKMLTDLSEKYQQVILFGEIIGDSIQSLHYGYKQQLGYRVFDLMVDGRYADTDDFLEICAWHKVPTVPILARIPYSFNTIKSLSEGKTTMLDGTGKTHIREGVVVKPVMERNDRKIGRLILKYVSDTYLVGKVTDFTEE